MTVLFLIDTLNVGGAEISLAEILPYFRKYRPIMVTVYPGNVLKNKFEKQGITVISLNVTDKYHFNEAAKLLKPIINQYKPVLLHSTLFRSDIISRSVKKNYGFPLVNSLVNNSYSIFRYRSLSWIGKLKLFGVQLLDAWTARSVDHFISNSQAIKISNRRALHLNKEKISVIYRGRSFKQFQQVDQGKIRLLKERFDLSGKKVFVNVSRLLDRKGQSDLIKAFSLIIHEFPKSVLVIAGEGEFRPYLEAQIRDLGLQHQAHLMGNFDTIPDLLSLADVFVFPSYYEGLPGALIEAMMAGKTILCSDIPENRECVNEDSALFFKPGDILKMKTLMATLIEQPQQFQSLGMKARDIARKKFDVAGIAAQYEALYDELMGV